MSVDNLYSPEEIEALKAQAGAPTPSSAPRNSEWDGRVDISVRNNKVTQPTIRDAQGNSVRSSRVRGPSKASVDAGVKREAEARAAEAAAIEAQEALREAHSPEKVEARLAYLERALKITQKQLKDLKGKSL